MYGTNDLRKTRRLRGGSPSALALLLAGLLGACSSGGDAPAEDTSLSEDARVENVPSVAQSAQVHQGLYEIVTSTADGSVWVAAVGGGFAEGARLIALDPVTLEERRVIDVDAAPAFGLDINNRTNTIYSSNTRAGNMSAIDLETGEVTLIELPGAEGAPHLFRVVVDEEANLVYATVFETPGSIWVVDGETNTLDRVITGLSGGPTGLELDAAGNRLFAASQGDNVVDVIDLSTDEVVASIPTQGERSTQLELDPATNRLFVTNQNSDNFSVIDTETNEFVQTVPTPEIPLGIAYHGADDLIYVAVRGAGVVAVYDGTTYEPVTELEIGTFPNTLYIDETTGSVYVTNKAARGEERDPVGDQVTLITR